MSSNRCCRCACPACLAPSRPRQATMRTASRARQAPSRALPAAQPASRAPAGSQGLEPAGAPGPMRPPSRGRLPESAGAVTDSEPGGQVTVRRGARSQWTAAVYYTAAPDLNIVTVTVTVSDLPRRDRRSTLPTLPSAKPGPHWQAASGHWQPEFKLLVPARRARRASHVGPHCQWPALSRCTGVMSDPDLQNGVARSSQAPRATGTVLLPQCSPELEERQRLCDRLFAANASI